MLVILPLLEQRTELVRGGTPVGVVAQGIGQSLGLLHNRGTFGQRLGDGGLVGLAQLGLLGRSGLLQCFELGLERLNISDDGRLLDFGGKRLDGLVDLTVLHIAGLEPVGEQVELCLQIEIATGIQCQGLFLGSVRELSDLAFSLAFLHEHGAVIGDTAERFGGLDIGFGESGGGCRTLRSLLGEGLGACGFMAAGLGTAGLLAWVAGVAACSLVSVVFSDAVIFSSAMASSLRKLHVVQG